MTGNGGKSGTQAMIGAFVFGGTVLVLGTIVLFGNFHFFTPTLRAVIVFQDSISGLTIGAPVTFRGVRVGAVDGITVQFDAKSGTAYIPVTVQLEPTRVTITTDKGNDTVDLPKLIARGLRAELNMQSFVTGQSEIDLDFDPVAVAVMHPSLTSLGRFQLSNRPCSA